MTLLRSRDGGRTWDGLAAPFGVNPLVALQAITGSANEQSVSLIAATYNERQSTITVWRSDDGGEHWTRGADSLHRLAGGPHLRGATAVWRSATRSPSASQTASGGKRRSARRDCGGWQATAPSSSRWPRDGLWRSGDSGLTWSRVAAGFAPDEIMDIALNGSDLFVLLTGGRLWSAIVTG